MSLEIDTPIELKKSADLLNELEELINDLITESDKTVTLKVDTLIELDQDTLIGLEKTVDTVNELIEVLTEVRDLGMGEYKVRDSYLEHKINLFIKEDSKTIFL